MFGGCCVSRRNIICIEVKGGQDEVLNKMRAFLDGKEM
jgi:hypothetical protein